MTHFPNGCDISPNIYELVFHGEICVFIGCFGQISVSDSQQTHEKDITDSFLRLNALMHHCNGTDDLWLRKLERRKGGKEEVKWRK